MAAAPTSQSISTSLLREGLEIAKRDQLRELRTGTIINLTAKQQETELGAAILSVVADIGEQFGLEMHHRREWRLTEIVDDLMAVFPEVNFERPGPRSSMKPDGGVLSLLDIEGKRHPILIAEVENQGTNDLREAEGKARPAMGNAIERLGKNVIGVRTAMMPEGIVPFVCFGYGIDLTRQVPFSTGFAQSPCLVNSIESMSSMRVSLPFSIEEASIFDVLLGQPRR